jgi:hypothetical protein
MADLLDRLDAQHRGRVMAAPELRRDKPPEEVGRERTET